MYAHLVGLCITYWPLSHDSQVLLRKGIEATAVISHRAVRDLSEKIPPAANNVANNVNPNANLNLTNGPLQPL